ncbi:Protein SET domain group 40 [Vitis vinifera]|uniref:Protein SET domain group 40 n=1 Tax=Vitis vinifera TaxID=29760 RepID=A0A438C9D4_VITVI|nr:Protein SET domain group 40 [Vitis vinifera]
MGDGAGNLGLHHTPTTVPSRLQIPHCCVGHSLCVSHFPHAGGRGLAAARDLSQGELILTVPKSALMTSQSLLKDEKLSVAVKGTPLSPLSGFS